MTRRARLRWIKNAASVEVVVTGTRCLGYGPEADIAVLTDGVAPRHAELEMRGDELWIRDLGSAGGTHVDGERVDIVRIPDAGATLRAGTLDLEVRYAGDHDDDDAVSGESPAIRALIAQLDALARDPRDVLVCGERGTGAIAVARSLHERSRPGERFVVLDCRAIPEVLIESSLFGYTRSACFGNPPYDSTNRRGPFEIAGAGTVVLVELAAMPDELHPKLARTFDLRSFRRVGCNQTRPIAARVIATSRRDLASFVAGASSEILRRSFASLAEVRLPPLRDRRDDVVPLLRRMIGPEVALAPEVLERLAGLRFPGNLTELAQLAGSIAAGPPRTAVIEHELLEAIAAAPGDLGTRLVYGDLLLSRGDPRGELVQIQCRLAGPAPSSAERARLRAAEATLLATHAAAWTAPLLERTRADAAELRRGFIEHVRGPGELLERLDPLFEHAPTLDDLHLDPVEALDDAHLASPLLGKLRRLHLSLAGDCDASAAAIARCSHLASLRELALSATTSAIRGVLPGPVVLGVAGARALARSPFLAGLTALELAGCHVTAAAIAALASRSARWQLSRLSLGETDDPALARAVLARSRTLAGTTVPR